MAEHIKVDEAERIAVVRIHRPDAKNAFSFQTIEELTHVARAFRRRSDLAVVILTGSGSIFSAGQDLRGSGAADAPKPSLVERRTAAAAGPDLVQAWEEIEAITIAAIEGYCIGGACALTLACDFRIMAASATLRLPEVPLGMSMPWRTVPRVTALAGASRAKQFLLFGRATDADTCLAWGLSDEITADGQALDRARDWALRVAALPPVPVRMTKEAVNIAAHANDRAVSFMDRDQHLLTTLTDDFQEGVRAFKEKRPPRFTGN